MFRDSLGLADVVDAAVGRVVLGLPVPVPEKVIANPLVLEIEACTCALRESKRKNGKERMARTHSQTRQEKGFERGWFLMGYGMGQECSFSRMTKSRR